MESAVRRMVHHLISYHSTSPFYSEFDHNEYERTYYAYVEWHTNSSAKNNVDIATVFETAARYAAHCEPALMPGRPHTRVKCSIQ